MNYAIVVSSYAGMWAHLIGDTVRFESLSPPLLTFTGRTRYSLSAFGEHLINEEVEEAISRVLEETGGLLRDWHLGPVFSTNRMGHHVLVVEFDADPADPTEFRDAVDAYLCRRNADYQAHRTRGAGLPAPVLVVAVARRLCGLDAVARKARRPEQGSPDGRHRQPHGRARRIPAQDHEGALRARSTDARGRTPLAAKPRRNISENSERRLRLTRAICSSTRRNTARGCPGLPGRFARWPRRTRARSRGRTLAVHERGDLPDRIEVLDTCLVCFDSDAEVVFEENHELQGSNRIEDAARDERSDLRELARVFAGKEFTQNKMLNDLGSFFHDGVEPLLLTEQSGSDLQRWSAALTPAGSKDAHEQDVRKLHSGPHPVNLEFSLRNIVPNAEQ